MGSLDEVIKKWARRVKRHPGTLLKWFDDAGAIRLGDRYIVVKVDGFAASRAMYPWCSFKDFGFRGVTAAVSDVIAKGCEPQVYAISIGVKSEHVDYIEDIMRGVEEAVNLYGGYIENVDTNVGYDNWIDVFVLGECKSLPLPRGAKPLSRLVLPRRIGLSIIGYTEYVKGRTPQFEEVKEFTCRPRACLSIVNVINCCRECIEGSIDISDTFAESLQQLSEVSKTGFYLFEDPSRILHPLAIDYSKREKIDLRSIVLAANEEYIPLLIVKPGCEDHVENYLRYVGLEPIVIGIATQNQNIVWLGRQTPKIIWNYVTGTISTQS